MGNEAVLEENSEVVTYNPEQSIFSRMRIFGGFVSLGLITAIFMGGLNYGQYTRSVDSNVAKIEKIDDRIEGILKQLKASEDIQTKMIASIESRDEFYMRVLEQQGRSDKDFLEVIKDIRKGVQDNSNNIFILRQEFKSSLLDTVVGDKLALR